ncbi:hypothetical protein [Vibrio coralliilyticus]|nr:hypothetical protein [Vibrio coralliilyticus]
MDQIDSTTCIMDNDADIFLISSNLTMNDNTFTIGIVRASGSVKPELDPFDFYPIETTYTGEQYSKHLASAEDECDELFIFSNHYGVLPLGYRAIPVPDEDEGNLAQCAQYPTVCALKKHICSFFDDVDSNDVNFIFNLYGDFPLSFRKAIEQ